MENAVIHLERQSAYADSLRAYRIFIDGKKNGTVRQTESALSRSNQGVTRFS